MPNTPTSHFEGKRWVIEHSNVPGSDHIQVTIVGTPNAEGIVEIEIAVDGLTPDKPISQRQALALGRILIGAAVEISEWERW